MHCLSLLPTPHLPHPAPAPLQHPDLLERTKWEAAEVRLERHRGPGGAPARGACRDVRQPPPLPHLPAFVLAPLFTPLLSHPLHSRPPLLRPQEYGAPQRSGKMQVLAKVLAHWREQGHK